MTAYYNEIDPFAAAWLRELIKAGAIAPGDVDERSIVDVRPSELQAYTQCHFFAGIGVWSYALRRAGFADDRPVWTGSCPCQPFSAAGKGGGFTDERHLWPAWHYLITECRPEAVLGEQVASKDGLGWLDLVQADLEGSGYACGPVDTCSAGVGLAWEESQAGEWLRRAIHDCGDPWVAAQLRDFADFARGNIAEGGKHIRQRLRFGAVRVDHHHHQGLEGQRSGHRAALGHGQGEVRPASEAGEPGGLAHPSGSGRREERQDGGRLAQGDRAQGFGAGSGAGCSDDGLAHPHGRQQQGVAELRGAVLDGPDAGRAQGGRGAAARGDDDRLAHPDGWEPRQAGRLQSGGQHGQQPQDGEPVERVADADRAGANIWTGDTSEAAGVPEAERQPEHDADVSERGGADHGGRRALRSDGLCGGGERPDPHHFDGRNSDWLFCRDDGWRAVGPGSFPLAHGAPARVGRLRGYGNAVDAEATVQFIEAFREALDDVSAS